jgi:hypothetical protein
VAAPSVTILTTRSSTAAYFEHVAQRARAMHESGAFLHLYQSLPRGALLEAIVAVEQLAQVYRRAGDPDY